MNFRAYIIFALLVVGALEVFGGKAKWRKFGRPNHEKGLLDYVDRQDYSKYKDVVNQIMNYVLYGPGKGAAYRKLQWLVDTYGARLAGTDALENAIDGVVARMKAEAFDNVHTEAAVVLNWRPVDYRLSVIAPRPINMSILALAPSVNTPPNGITANILVVRSFAELDQRANEAKGKIVVFNQDFVSYEVSVEYRVLGAQNAAKYGAVGALIRSITPFSIYSPHTGFQIYDDTGSIPKIPVASITVEDAELFQRLANGRSDTVQVRLYIEANNLGSRTSRNTIAELSGSTKPDETVLISGHLDSWYVGVGAMDDGGGAVVSWESLSVLNELNLRAARTVRTILWTGEEQAGVGSDQYFKVHKNEVPKMDFVMESDIGTFRPTGLNFTGNAAAQQVMKQVLQLLAPINATQLMVPDESTDISEWEAAGVPGASLISANEKYFYFHHTAGDTLTVENSDELDLCVVLWSSVAYIVADLDQMLPRNSTSTGYRPSRMRTDRLL